MRRQINLSGISASASQLIPWSTETSARAECPLNPTSAASSLATGTACVSLTLRVLSSNNSFILSRF